MTEMEARMTQEDKRGATAAAAESKSRSSRRASALGTSSSEMARKARRTSGTTKRPTSQRRRSDARDSTQHANLSSTASPSSSSKSPAPPGKRTSILGASKNAFHNIRDSVKAGLMGIDDDELEMPGMVEASESEMTKTKASAFGDPESYLLEKIVAERLLEAEEDEKDKKKVRVAAKKQVSQDTWGTWVDRRLSVSPSPSSPILLSLEPKRSRYYSMIAVQMKKYLRGWKVIHCLILWVICIYTPYDLAFTEEIQGFNLVLNIVLWAFSVIHIPTSWYESAINVHKTPYYRSGLWFDLLSATPWVFIGSYLNDTDIQKLRIFFVFHLLRWKIIHTRVYAAFEEPRIMQQIAGSHKLQQFCILVMCCHWMCCLLRLFIPLRGYSFNYIDYFYFWGPNVIAKIGNDDYWATDATSRFAFAFLSLFGSFELFKVTGFISTLMLDPRWSEHYRYIDDLNHLSSRYHIPSAIRVKAREYFKSVYRPSWSDILPTVNQFSPMILSIFIRNRHRWLMRVWFFHNLRTDVVCQISKQLVSQDFGPLEYFAKPFNLYYIIDGVCARRGKLINRYSSFGEEQLLLRWTAKNRYFHTGSLSNIKVVRLSAQSFEDVLIHFPEENQKIRRAFLFYARFVAVRIFVTIEKRVHRRRKDMPFKAPPHEIERWEPRGQANVDTFKRTWTKCSNAMEKKIRKITREECEKVHRIGHAMIDDFEEDMEAQLDRLEEHLKRMTGEEEE